MSHRRIVAVLSFPLLILAACEQAPPADLVFTGGKVVTMDAANPQAQAIAVSGDTVVAVGTDAQIQRYVGDGTQVVDLAGRTVVPGFIESHGHFMGLGSSLQQLDLMHARTWNEIVGMVRDAVADAQPGEWILGRGWHQEKWDEAPPRVVAGFQTNDLLNQVAPNNPVLLVPGALLASKGGRPACLASCLRSTSSHVLGSSMSRSRGSSLAPWSAVGVEEASANAGGTTLRAKKGDGS